MKTLNVLALGLVASIGGGIPAQDDTRIVPDVVYGHKLGMALTLDVFMPEGDANGAGILEMVSNAWVSTWRPPERARREYQPLLDRGFTVFAVRHGSRPVFTVPDAVRDVQSALQFVHANAARFGVDPRRLGVHGGSAGGHLALMLGLAPAGDGTDSPTDLVAAVVAYFPPVDMRELAPNLDPSDAASISPILFASKEDPPTLLVHGTEDTMIPISNSESLFEALREQGVTSEIVVIEGAGHGFRPGGEADQRASKAMIAWFESHLLPAKD